MGMATVQQQGGEGDAHGGGEASSEIWSFSSVTFIQGFALRLLGADPYEDGEEACLPPNSFSGRPQILAPKNISPGPHNIFLGNL